MILFVVRSNACLGIFSFVLFIFDIFVVSLDYLVLYYKHVCLLELGFLFSALFSFIEFLGRSPHTCDLACVCGLDHMYTRLFIHTHDLAQKHFSVSFVLFVSHVLLLFKSLFYYYIYFHVWISILHAMSCSCIHMPIHDAIGAVLPQGR